MLLQAVYQHRRLIGSSSSRPRGQVIFEPEKNTHGVLGACQTSDKLIPYFRASTMMRRNDSSDRITHFLSHLDGQFSVQNSMAILNPVAPEVLDFNEKKEHHIVNGGKSTALVSGRRPILSR